MTVAVVRYSQVPSLAEPLARQVSGLKKGLETFHLSRLVGILLFGSVARGQATYRSDVDLLVILAATHGQRLSRDVAGETIDRLEACFEQQGQAHLLHHPLAVQVTTVLDTVFDTDEPAMRQALREGLILSDPGGTLGQRTGH